MRLKLVGLVIPLVALLGACADSGLRSFAKPGEGPDEFKVTPGLPLQEPTSYSELPPPTPGGSNITDQQPLQTSVAALGGRLRTDTGSIPGSDGAIVNHASRFGRDGAIRQVLATEDEAFRKRRGRFTKIRISRQDSYLKVYKREALNADQELERWRRAGARTPSAPPN